MNQGRPAINADSPLAYRVVRGSVWVAASSYWQLGFGFIANIFLTRLLFPEAFGAFSLALFFSQLFRLQPRLGLGRAFAQEPDTDGVVFGTYLALEGLAAILSLIVGVIAVPMLVSMGYAQDVARGSSALLIAGVLESFAGIANNVLDKDLQFRSASLVRAITFPLSYAPAFWLASHDGSAWSLVAQSLAFNVLSCVGIWWILNHSSTLPCWRTWRFDKNTAVRLLHFGLTVGILSLLGVLLTQLDSFYIGTFVDERELGFYDRAYRMAQWPTLLLNALITRTAFYTYAKLQDDPTRLRRTVEKVLWLIVNLSTSMFLILMVTAPDLLTLLYTTQWLSSTIYLRILIVSSLIRPLMMNANTLLTATGKPGLTVKYSLLQLAVFAVAGYLLTARWGAAGAGVSTGLMLTTGVILSYRHIAQETNTNLRQFLMVPVIAAILVLVGYWALNRATGLTQWPLIIRVGTKSLYAVGTFAALTLLAQPKTTVQQVKYVLHLGRDAL